MNETDKRFPTTSTASTVSTASKRTLALIWATLINRRLVSEPVGSLQHKQFESDMADLSDEELRRGLGRTLNFTGFFTLPIFRNMCRPTPEDIGLPNNRQALLEAIHAPWPKNSYAWSHPAVFLAANTVGWYAIDHLNERELMPLWSAAYDAMVARVVAGEHLTVPVQQALPKKPEPIDPELAKAKLAKIKEMLS